MKRSCLILLCHLFLPSFVFAGDYRFDVSGGDVILSDDSLIYTGVAFEPLSVRTTETLQIDNYGTINSEFFVCDGCDLYIKNVGEFKADINLGTNSSLIQVVNNSNDMNALSFSGDFDVLVENDSMITLGEVVNFANRADKIILKDSVLKIDGVIGLYKTIELRGKVDLVADDLTQFYGTPVLTNITGDGSVRIINNNPDVLYADVGFINDGTLYVKRVRETDYVKIFKDDTGKFLNELRVVNPNDSLFDVLDCASDMVSLRYAMEKSVRFNPEILVRSLNVLHMFDRLETNTSENALSFSPFVIWSNDFNLYGLNVGLSGRVMTGLDVWGGLRVGVLEYDSDLDAFSGQVWGANFGAKYTMKNNLFVRANLGADVMNVDVGNVLYDDVIYMNPHSMSGALSIDFGYGYSLQHNFYFEPFVGIKSDWWYVENVSEFNTDVIVGLGAGYSYSMLGLHYDYFIRGIAMANGDVGVSGRVGVWSEFDAFGGDVEISAVQMYGAMNYKIAFNARVWF